MRRQLAGSQKGTPYGQRSQVETVASGEHALRIAPDLKPDVVVTDSGLPGLSGEEVAKRLGGQQVRYDEDIVKVSIVGLGIWFAFVRSRPLPGAAIALAGAAWTLVAVFVIAVTFLPILIAYYLTRDGDSVAGMGK